MSLPFKFERIGQLQFIELIQRWNKEAKPVVLDTESTGLERTDKLLSLQLCQAGSTHAYYVDASLASLLRSLTTPIVLQNFKHDFLVILLACGVDLRSAEGTKRPARDTMLLHHLVDENAEHSLDSMVKARWNDPYKEQFWAKYKAFQDAPEDEALDYACRDVVYTGLLYLELTAELERQGVPETLVEQVHAFALSLYDTEVKGVRVDLDYLTKVGGELKERIASAAADMRAAAPLAVEAVEQASWIAEMDKRKTVKGKARVKRPPFNWNSGDQLKQLIYGELGIKAIERKSKSTGEWGPVLDDAALEDLKDEHPLISRLRDYRADEKVFGSFIEGTLDRHVGGRIYPSLNVNGTVGSRISSSNPNLQQLPASGGVRGIYVPDPGCLLVGCDYGQLEVVVAAHYSKDPALLKIIYEGASKHDITAAGLGIPRTLAKRINFALGYGATEWKVKEILGCSLEDAKGALRLYWETYAGEKRVIDECTARLDAGLPIITLFGRHRRFPNRFPNAKARARACRQAYNSLIQSTGGEITNIAYVKVHKQLQKLGIGRTLFPVHDEILIEAQANAVYQAEAVLKIEMIASGKVLSVPLGVASSGPMPRWED